MGGLPSSMGRITAAFARHFRPWGLRLPPGHVRHRQRGKIVAQGWAIWYLFGGDEQGEYLDYYASHRMTDDNHVRLRATGAVEYLPAIPGFRRASEDPAEDARLDAEHTAKCREISNMLRAKGFGLEGDEPGGVVINTLLRSGLVPDE